jgi:hypothetical protein
MSYITCVSMMTFKIETCFIKHKNLVVSTICYVTTSLEAQWGCPTLKLTGFSYVIRTHSIVTLMYIILIRLYLFLDLFHHEFA